MFLCVKLEKAFTYIIYSTENRQKIWRNWRSLCGSGTKLITFFYFGYPWCSGPQMKPIHPSHDSIFENNEWFGNISSNAWAACGWNQREEATSEHDPEGPSCPVGKIWKCLSLFSKLPNLFSSDDASSGPKSSRHGCTVLCKEQLTDELQTLLMGDWLLDSWKPTTSTKGPRQNSNRKTPGIRNGIRCSNILELLKKGYTMTVLRDL